MNSRIDGDKKRRARSTHSPRKSGETNAVMLKKESQSASVVGGPVAKKANSNSVFSSSKAHKAAVLSLPTRPIESHMPANAPKTFITLPEVQPHESSKILSSKAAAPAAENFVAKKVAAPLPPVAPTNVPASVLVSARTSVREKSKSSKRSVAVKKFESKSLGQKAMEFFSFGSKRKKRSYADEPDVKRLEKKSWLQIHKTGENHGSVVFPPMKDVQVLTECDVTRESALRSLHARSALKNRTITDSIWSKSKSKSKSKAQIQSIYEDVTGHAKRLAKRQKTLLCLMALLATLVFLFIIIYFLGLLSSHPDETRSTKTSSNKTKPTSKSIPKTTGKKTTPTTKATSAATLTTETMETISITELITTTEVEPETVSITEESSSTLPISSTTIATSTSTTTDATSKATAPTSATTITAETISKRTVTAPTQKKTKASTKATS